MADVLNSGRLRPRPNLKQEAAGYLRDLILRGQLKPGDKVDQDLIAGQLGVSKLPGREALITLETEGFVVNVARRGSFVAPLTSEDVLDHYEIYGLVSGLAAGRAFQLTDEDLAVLEDVLGQMAASGEPDEQERLNLLFHRRINKAGGTRRLLSVMDLLTNMIPTRFFASTPDWPARAHKDHRHILDALRNRDAEAATTAMRAHLHAAGEYAVRLLEASGFWGPETSA